MANVLDDADDTKDVSDNASLAEVGKGFVANKSSKKKKKKKSTSVPKEIVRSLQIFPSFEPLDFCTSRCRLHLDTWQRLGLKRYGLPV